MVLSSDKLKEDPGNTIPGYCFTDTEFCSKISPLTHNCLRHESPRDKCRPNLSIGCVLAPGRVITNGEKTRIRIGQQKSKKRRKTGKVGSQTPGSTKGLNCQATPLQRYCAKYSRAYKKPFYKDVMDGLSKGK